MQRGFTQGRLWIVVCISPAPAALSAKGATLALKGLKILFLDTDFASTVSRNLSFQNWKHSECLMKHDFQLQQCPSTRARVRDGG